MSTVVLYWCHKDSASVLLYFTFLAHLFPLLWGAGSTVPARCSTQVLLCLFPGVLCLWHFLYSVGPHLKSSLHIYTFDVSRAFMAGAASQARDADSSRTPGLTSGLQGSVNVHRGALLLVHQFFCILYFYHTCFLCRVELVAQFPARGFDSSVSMPFSWCVVAVTLPI